MIFSIWEGHFSVPPHETGAHPDRSHNVPLCRNCSVVQPVSGVQGRLTRRNFFAFFKREKIERWRSRWGLRGHGRFGAAVDADEAADPDKKVDECEEGDEDRVGFVVDDPRDGGLGGADLVAGLIEEGCCHGGCALVHFAYGFVDIVAGVLDSWLGGVCAGAGEPGGNR